MNDKFFLDSNILIYSFDSRDLTKQQRAQQLISQALSKQIGIISYQVTQEVLNTARRKFEKKLSIDDCQLLLTQVLIPICQVYPCVELYQKALNIHEQLKFSFYDSLVVAAALQAKCQTLYTEDLHHGQVIDSTLRIINPFCH
ncbi:MAG: PIN domain-containing protein [Thiotrichaceae bacterium]